MVLIISIVILLIGMFIGYVWACIYCGKDFRSSSLQYSEQNMLNYWIERNRNERRNMFLFFLNNNYYNIAIYGISGIHYDSFIEDTMLRGFRNVYLADKYAVELSKQKGEKIYTKEELKALDLDAIVITSDTHFKEIKEELDALQLNTNIFSYRDLVYNLRKEKLE